MVPRYRGRAAIMTATITPVDSAALTLTRTVLLSVLPAGVEVIAGMDNGVPMPLNPFVVMTLLSGERLAFNENTAWVGGASNPGTATINTRVRYTVQLDFYGPGAAENAALVQTLWADDYLWATAPANMKPLYAEDAMKLAFINGEQIYENRWVMKVALEAINATTVTQDMATALAVSTESAIREFPNY